jgi:hypothetical protein
MAAGLSPYGEFIVLFNNLKKETKDTPKRVQTFYPENPAIRDALDALEDFLSRTDLERRVFHGPRKLFRQVPAEFEAAWKEYAAKWRFRRAAYASVSGDTIGCGGVCEGMIEQRANISRSG